MLLSHVFIYVKAPMHINSQLGFSKFHHYAKLRRNRLNYGRDVAIFRFLRWRPPPSWIFVQNFKFLTFGTVKRVELRNHAKFCRNRSNRGRDIAIFRIFKMADAAMLDF